MGSFEEGGGILSRRFVCSRGVLDGRREVQYR